MYNMGKRGYLWIKLKRVLVCSIALKELYAQKYDVTKDVRKHQWSKFINEIPSDEENIIFNYLDRTDEVNEEEQKTRFF